MLIHSLQRFVSYLTSQVMVGVAKNQKQKFEQEKMSPQKIYAKWNPKEKNSYTVHDKVLNLCAPRLKSGAKEARLIITWDQAQF